MKERAGMRKRMLPVLLAVLLLAGCAAQAPGGDSLRVEGPTGHASRPVYALVVKSVENPYMLTMYDGFLAACEELGALAQMHGQEGTESGQAALLAALIEQGVSAIAIAANDMEEVSDMLRLAMDQGIPVVSLDSMVKPDERKVHIQQTSPEMIGRVLIQACAQMMEGEGEFAILSTTDAMPNQVSWVRWMRQELADHPSQYEKMTLVELAYGLDEREASIQAVRRLLAAYPDLKAIIAPTTVGMRAAAEVIEAEGSGVKLTGLGLPSEMEPYIMNGICPWMYLWNPAEVGYLAAYAMDALERGEMDGRIDEILAAGDLGDKVVTGSEDGGTEIVLGNPKVFDLTNIAVWGELF